MTIFFNDWWFVECVVSTLVIWEPEIVIMIVMIIYPDLTIILSYRFNH